MIRHLPFDVTPVTELGYYSSILDCRITCKRDDMFSEVCGGSKARMLQYILSEINSGNCEVLLTAGGPCSNFNRACALMCAKLGVTMHLVEYTDDLDEFNNSLNYYICRLSNVKTTRCQKTKVVETIKNLLSKYKSEGTKVKYIYGGGKSLEGIYAYYDAIREIYNQKIDVDHLFVACGTGTTLTGICAGMQKYYPNAKIHGISVARKFKDELPVLQEDMSVLNDYLGETYSFYNLDFTDKYLCGGYNSYNEEIIDTIKECISREGMIIDPTYSGKAFWGMKCIMSQTTSFSGKNILFWNTGGLFNLLSERNGIIRE